MSKGSNTKQRIVAEAAALFNQRGFEGSSMNALMDATGLEKGGIYRHFSNKEEIALEAFDYAWNLATKERMHDLDTAPNSVDKLKLFLRNFVERRPAVPGGCPVLNTAIDTDDGNPHLRLRAQRALRQWIGFLASIARKGIDDGEIRKDVDPAQLATLIVSTLEGALMISRLEQNRKSLHTVASHLEDHLEANVRHHAK